MRREGWAREFDAGRSCTSRAHYVVRIPYHIAWLFVTFRHAARALNTSSSIRERMPLPDPCAASRDVRAFLPPLACRT